MTIMIAIIITIMKNNKDSKSNNSNSSNNDSKTFSNRDLSKQFCCPVDGTKKSIF